ALEAPFLAVDLVAEAELDRVGVEDVAGEPITDEPALLVDAQPGHGAESIALALGDALPERREALERIGVARVVGRERDHEPAMGLARRPVPRHLEAAVLLAQVADRE